MRPSGDRVSNRPEDREPTAPTPNDGSDDVADASVAGGTFVELPHTSLEDTRHGGDRARFEPAELRRVLDSYPLGEVTRIRELEAGSRQAPKVRITSSEGEFLLKRRVARPEAPPTKPHGLWAPHEGALQSVPSPVNRWP